AALTVGSVAVVIAATAIVLTRDTATRLLPATFYFAVVWMVLGIAPTLVAGYASPRHMYLASVGWAITLGIALECLWRAEPSRFVRPVVAVAAAVVLVTYTVRLAADLGRWETRSQVSQRVVTDLEREARAATPGTLIVVGAPRQSWDFAVPHAMRPPFTSEDLTRRVIVISDSSISCCPAAVWQPQTR